MTFSSRKKTKAEQRRSDMLHECECLACLQLTEETGNPMCGGRPTEHHTDGRTKKGAHLKTVCLCSWHHLQEPHHGWSHASMAAEYGPSLAAGSKPFHARFGSDKSLLERQNAILRGESC